MRGGSWNNNPANGQASIRNNNNPDNRNNNVGFSVVRQHSRRRVRIFRPEFRFLRKPGACLRESRSIFLVHHGWTEERSDPPVTRSHAYSGTSVIGGFFLFEEYSLCYIVLGAVCDR